jgi:hypothetical protein
MMLALTLPVMGWSQIFIAVPREGEVSLYRSQAVIGSAPAGWKVRLEVNGVAVDSTSVRTDGVFEFLGVPVPDGPVVFTVSTRLKNGRSPGTMRRIHVIGAPDSLHLRVPETQLQADGHSSLTLTATVVDRWKVVVPSGYFVTVSADSLTFVEKDADPVTPGHQLRLDSGKVAVTVKSSGYVGSSPIKFSTNGISASTEVYAITPIIPFFLIGSADGTGKHMKSKGDINGVLSPDDFREGLRGEGRFAATGRGTVFDKYLLTLSIDTDRKLQDRIFRDLDPNVLYSMYGDNSIVQYEAQSTSPLFVKMERNRSYMMFGDFNTEMTRFEYAAYNRSFTGGRLHLEDKPYTLDAFGTITNRKVIQEEIRGQGISGYYFLRQNNVVTGSEKVRIESRDRFHSEVVINRHDKARYSDYEIDYIQGSLYFKQPVPSLDEQNNPVYIVISYEANSNTADNFVAGGSGELRITDNLAIGGTAVVEDRLPQNYTLYGGSARWSIDSIGTISGEVAASANEEKIRGSAWKVEAELSPLRKLTLRPYFRRVDGTFINPTQSGSGRELGTIKYGGAISTEPLAGTSLHLEGYKQEYAMGTLSTDIQSMAGTLRQTMWNGGSIEAKIEDVKYKGENPDAPAQDLNTHSTIVSGKMNATIIEGLRTSAEFDRNLRQSEKEARPDGVGFGIEYDVTKAVSVSAQQKFLQGQGRLTTFGVNTRITDETTVYGRYEMGGTIAGERNAATIGLKNSLKLSDALTANFMYEKTKDLAKNLVEARTPDHDALSASLEYLPSFPLRATVKGELSEDQSGSRKGADYGVTFKVLDNLSVLSKGTYMFMQQDNNGGSSKISDYVFGVAYRPAATNWLNLIGKLQIKSAENTLVEPVESYRATILSAHAYIEPVTGVELGLKYALKSATDGSGGVDISTLTDFVLCRLQYDLTPNWNVAGEARFLRQHRANDLKTGYSLETGYVVLKNTMLSIGYNFQAYSDRDLVENIYSVAGPYITLRWKFTESLFGIGEED